MPETSGWHSYTSASGDAPEEAKRAMAQAAARQPAAVIQITIHGEKAGQAAVSVSVSPQGPFAATQAVAGGARQASYRNLSKVALRELQRALTELGS